jgi:hypothetical protein
VRADQSVHTVTHARAYSSTLYHERETLTLDIPLTATPTFITDLRESGVNTHLNGVCAVQHKWRLHFEFVTVADASRVHWPIDNGGSVDGKGGAWSACGQLGVETMAWQAPIKVFPSYPLNICLLSPYAQHMQIEMMLA